MRTLAAALMAVFMLFGVGPVALAAGASDCKGHKWVHDDQYGPPPPYPMAEHALSPAQIAAYISAVPGAPENLTNPKNKVEADAFLYPAPNGVGEPLIVVIWFANGCAVSQTRPMPASVFEERLKGSGAGA